LPTSTYLKYLFHVVYKDGTEFQQTQEDISKSTPGGSAYSDVDVDNVRAFYLMDAEEGWYVAQINVEDGKFSVNDGVLFSLGDPGPRPYKLIFWRQHTHNFNVEYVEQSHIVKYIIGYADADGGGHTIHVE
jgi:hypothetical protein